ncbi:MAG: DUF4349 domain-containing protein [Myxococcales bacterium]|nr:DUF4349 domain-containing protein [Polyangiaceae bacterium]MDW8250971.1 DUF4349 domain-containing protein [Myxococcales bacterium]
MTPRAALASACFLVLLSVGTPACAKRESEPASSAPAAAEAAPAAPQAGGTAGKLPEAAPRKIIKNANLSIEAEKLSEVRDRAIHAAEKVGGYVAASTEHNSGDDGVTSISLTLKVPVDRLTETLAALRGMGTRTTYESVTSQDVSAEFYDLEARLRAQRAIEAQLLEIVKEAKTVPDLLAVQRQLGEVREEIERMEGRRNQLDQQASLSTIQLAIHRRAGSSSLATTVSQAGSDAQAVLSALVHGSIRVAGVLGPLALFFGPLGLIGFFLVRRIHRRIIRV